MASAFNATSIHVYRLILIISVISSIMAQLSFSKDWRAGGKRSSTLQMIPKINMKKKNNYSPLVVSKFKWLF